MTTFNEDGAKSRATPADEQLSPPPEYTPEPEVIDAPPDEYPARPFRDGEPRSEGAVARVAPDPADDVPDAPEEDTGTAVALVKRFDISKTDEVWPFEFLNFKGDVLGIRLPQRQALAAFSLASSKYVSLGVKNDLTGLFIARHLSPESYGRVFSRLMDPDEDDYDVDTVGELFNAIVTASLDADKADSKPDDAG